MPSEEPAEPLKTAVAEQVTEEEILSIYSDSPLHVHNPNMSEAEKALNVAKMNAGLTPPSDGSVARDYDANSPYGNEVTDEGYVRLIKEDGLATQISDVWPRAVGGKEPGIRDDVGGKLADEINGVLRDLGFWSKHQLYYKSKRDRAVALMSIGWADDMVGDELALPTKPNVEAVDYVHVIQRSLICGPGEGPGGMDGIVEGLDPNEETYGDILYYWLNLPTGRDRTKIRPAKRHASRFTHWAHPSPDGSIYGHSQFGPMWNLFRAKAQMDTAIPRTVRRFSSLIPLWTHPQDTSKEQKTTVRKNLAALDSGSVVDLDEGQGLKLMGTADALNPQPYIDYVLDLIAYMSLGNKVILFGTPSGKQTGSEVNERIFYSRAADEQRNVYGPKAREMIDLFRQRGVIREKGNYWFEWPAIKELDDLEKAQLDLTVSQAFQSKMLTLTSATGEQFSPQVDDDGTMFLENDTKTISIPVPAMNSRKKPKAVMNASVPWMPQEEKDALYAEWKIKTGPMGDKIFDSLTAGFREFKKAFDGQFMNTWEAVVGEVDSDLTPVVNVDDVPLRPYSQAEELAIVKTMREWDHHYPGFEDEMAIGLEMAYKGEVENGATLYKNVKTPGAITDSGTVNIIKDRGMELADDTVMKGKRGAMRAIRQGLSAGENYSQVSDRIAGTYKDSSKDFRATSQKVVHEAMSEARFDTLKAHGDDEGVWLSAGDDNVRLDPVSHQIDGVVMSRSRAMQADYLPAYGCRCCIIPKTPYLNAVKDWEKKSDGLGVAG